MKDYPQEDLESSRPSIDGLDAVEFCLAQLFKDDKRNMRDCVVKNLAYEEIIGALLLARDEMQATRG